MRSVGKSEVHVLRCSNCLGASFSVAFQLEHHHFASTPSLSSQTSSNLAQLIAMTDSDDYGDSDDEALLFAATQVEDASQAAGGFDASPRPSKRRKTTDDDHSNASGDEFDDEELLAEINDGEGGEEPAKVSKYQMHAPRINANLDRVVLTQTQQALAPTQPWMIRGPIWRKPKPVEPPVLAVKSVNIQTSAKGSEDAAPRRDSDEDEDMDVQVPRAGPRLGGMLPKAKVQL